MCSILGYLEKGDNSKLRLRGQDLTNTIVKNGFTFVHNLLSVTGEFTPQPFVKGEIIALYNGEIYNQPFEKSDGECLIPLYEKYGTDFPKYLDGEFAIVLFDFKKGIALYATDPFKTKPLFINGLEFATYRSGVGGEKANPNEIVVKKISTGEIVEVKTVYEWDFKQSKTTYNDWIIAFRSSIAKRAKQGCFLGLSSGYDSGAIACEMAKQGIKFKAYTFPGSENKEILYKRLERHENEVFNINYALLPFLQENLDNEKYTIYYKGEETEMRLLTDGGGYGVATLCDLAHKEGRKVCLSSQGADEIMSDYSLFPDQSELKGVYPSDLKLWRNFNYGCQESYLMKEEYYGGSFNIETRYPFLDKKVVQEFLWLTPELKNAFYKAPLREYLTRENYPFDEGVKIGFSVPLTK
jgi:asparagine synthetase B (glutamine-hydrolysing)